MIGRFRAWAGGVAWLIGWRIARMIPASWTVAGFEWMGRRSYRRNQRRRETVAANLAPLVPAERLDATVRDAFRWYGRYWAETFRMQDLRSEELNRRFRITGQEYIDEAYARGRGAIMAVPHMGNWDAAGRWAAERWRLAAVAEVLRPAMVFERFLAHRRALGMTVIPLERGGDVTARCLERLEAGDLLALVADRDLTSSGVRVQMFGRTTSMPAGPAVLSIRSGAPLIPACVYQHDDGTWSAVIVPPIAPAPDAADPVADLTQRLAAAFEPLIAAAPAQWHVFAPYWIDA